MQILRMTKIWNSEITEVVENLLREKPSIGFAAGALAKHILPETVEIHAGLCFFGGRYILHETLSGFRFF